MRKMMIAALFLLFATASAYGDCLLTFQTEALQLFVSGEKVNFQLEGVSGTPPYHFALVQGQLPPGLHLTGSGKIKGRVGQVATETYFTPFIQLSDNAGCVITQAFNAEVWPTAP
jgi:hypothetical protein